MNNKIAIVLFLFLIISVPLINFAAFDNNKGDPFVAHVIVTAYVLVQEHSVDGVVNYLSTHFPAYTWQQATSIFFEQGITGTPLLLFTLGSVTAVDFIDLGQSPILFFICSIAFLLLVFRVMKISGFEKRYKNLRAALYVTLIGVLFDVIYNYVLNKLMSFQYHALGIVFYFLIIYLFLQMLSNQFTTKRIILFIVLYSSLLLTHYRYPALIVVNLLIITILYFILGYINKNSSLIRTAKKTMAISLTSIMMLALSPFYLYTLQTFGSKFLDYGFLLSYFQSIITFDNIERTEIIATTFQYQYAVPWKYINYLEVIIFALLLLILVVILIKKTKDREVEPYDALFIWSSGSTVFMILTYFMVYQGQTGVGLYEVFLFLLFSSFFFTFSPKRKNSSNGKKKMGIVAYLSILLAIIVISNSLFGINYQLNFNSYPIQPVNAVRDSYFFIGRYMGDEKIISSSFSASADMYQYFAKTNLTYLERLGFRYITNEVSIYHTTGDFSMMYNRLAYSSDYFLLTTFEINNGLSSDVLGYGSYMTVQEVQTLQGALITRENIVYSSGNSFIYSFIK